MNLKANFKPIYLRQNQSMPAKKSEPKKAISTVNDNDESSHVIRFIEEVKKLLSEGNLNAALNILDEKEVEYTLTGTPDNYKVVFYFNNKKYEISCKTKQEDDVEAKQKDIETKNGDVWFAKMSELFVKTAKESTQKIKELTEELKSLKRPFVIVNGNMDEVNNYISKIKSLQKQANEAYGALDNIPISIKCIEKDALVFAYHEFSELVREKLSKVGYY